MNFYKIIIIVTALSAVAVTVADNNDCTYGFSTDDGWECNGRTCMICASEYPICIVVEINGYNTSLSFTFDNETITAYDIDSGSDSLCFPLEAIPLATACLTGHKNEIGNDVIKTCVALDLSFLQKTLFQFQLACFKLEDGRLSVLISRIVN